MTASDDDVEYLTVEDVIEIHGDIIGEDADATSGIERPDRISYAVEFIRCEMPGRCPETIPGKAFHLMRLIASNHWFVDGNKRTALNSAEVFLFINGYEFSYGEDIRSMLKLFSVREGLIDEDVGIQYIDEQLSPISFEFRLTKREESIQDQLSGAMQDAADQIAEEMTEMLDSWKELVGEPQSIDWNLHDITVNTEEREEEDQNGG